MWPIVGREASTSDLGVRVIASLGTIYREKLVSNVIHIDIVRQDLSLRSRQTVLRWSKRAGIHRFRPVLGAVYR